MNAVGGPASLQPAPANEKLDDRRHRLLARIIIISAVLIGATMIVLAAVPWPWGVRLVGNVVARTVIMDLGEPLDLDIDAEIRPADVTIHGATQVTPLDDAPPPERTAARYRLTGSKLRLSGLHVLGGGRLTLSNGPGGLSISVADAGASLDFEVAQPSAKLDAKPPASPPTDSTAFALVTASKDGAAGPPLLLQAAGASDLDLDEFAVSRLQFGQYRGASGSGRPFSSSVMSGTVNVVETGRSETLEPGSAVSLEGFKGAAVRVTLEPKGVHIWFTGAADDFRVGSATLQIGRVPTAMEAIYYRPNYRLLFVCLSSLLTAVVAILEWHSGEKPGSSRP